MTTGPDPYHLGMGVADIAPMDRWTYVDHHDGLEAYYLAPGQANEARLLAYFRSAYSHRPAARLVRAWRDYGLAPETRQ